MRKALRIISISAGIISVVSAVVLGYIYLEDIVGYIKKVKTKAIFSKKWLAFLLFWKIFITAPFLSTRLKKKSRVCGFFFLYSSLFSFHSSLFSKSPTRLFQRRDKREEKKENVASLPWVEKHWFLVKNMV